MPISNLLDITEKGAPRILELWQESVLLQLKANTPKLTGTLAKALFVKHPIVKTGSGFVTGLGDKKMIGVDPFEKPPPNTISRFLDWWRDTPEGIREAKERQKKRDNRATKSARSEIERMTARAEREMERHHKAVLARQEAGIEGLRSKAYDIRGEVQRKEERIYDIDYMVGAWKERVGLAREEAISPGRGEEWGAEDAFGAFSGTFGKQVTTPLGEAKEWYDAAGNRLTRKQEGKKRWGARQRVKRGERRIRTLTHEKRMLEKQITILEAKAKMYDRMARSYQKSILPEWWKKRMNR